MIPTGGPAGWPAAPPGRRLYAIGDVHGRLDLLDAALARLAADSAARPPPAAGLAVILLGDLVDRGPDSAGVVERLVAGPPAAGPLAGADWLSVLGNHETYLRGFLADPSLGPVWMANGGRATVQSYLGRSSQEEEGPDDFVRLRDRLARAVPAAQQDWLRRLPLWRAEGTHRS